MIQRLESPPYDVDPGVLRRFDQRKTVFARARTDTDADFYGRSVHENSVEAIASGQAGYSRIDYARSRAAWTVCDHFVGAYSWDRLGDDDPSTAALGRYDVTDVPATSGHIKEAAIIYGADLVGISELDRRWVYSHDQQGSPFHLPSAFRYSIVMGLRMDPVAIRTSPAFSAATAVGVGYSRMAFAIACLAEFIRNLGYNAIPMGNDTALSIPLAIDAGLGELGRNGLLVTPQFGPCVRLCKVFTDLPLEVDSPIRFGLESYCERCGKCAEACEVGAISATPAPSFETVCPSNNQGIRRWAVDHDKCYSFWVDNGGDCSTCIASCPFTSGSRSQP